MDHWMKSLISRLKSVQNSPFKIILKFYNYCNCKGRNSITATADVSDKLEVKSFRTQDAQYQWSFFRIFKIIIFCFVVDICDLVHAVEAMYSLP